MCALQLFLQQQLPILLPVLLELFSLTLAVLIDPYIRKPHRRYLLVIMLLVYTLIAQNLLDYQLQFSPELIFTRTVVSVYGYCGRPAILVLFMQLVSSEKRYRLCWILVGVNALIYCTAFFSDIAISFSSGSFFRGPLGLSCHVLSVFLLVVHLVQVLRKYRDVRKPEALLPIVSVCIVVAATVADLRMTQNPFLSFVTIAAVSCSLMYYLWLHLQFVREHEQALMLQQRVRIMMSQIQPHFLYNTLSTIQALCRIDPEKAFDTLEMFGTYLRQNLDSLDQPHLIPFRKELEHTQVYAEIEQIRFPSIVLEYDIEDDDFSVPPLTVQPLVENAIRHGVRVREHGRVEISTATDERWHIITIRDNGKGFDTQADADPQKTHIGIGNVRERIESMCAGTLQIESQPDAGTTVTIRIPRGKETV